MLKAYLLHRLYRVILKTVMCIQINIFANSMLFFFFKNAKLFVRHLVEVYTLCISKEFIFKIDIF